PGTSCPGKCSRLFPQLTSAPLSYGSYQRPAPAAPHGGQGSGRGHRRAPDPLSPPRKRWSCPCRWEGLAASAAGPHPTEHGLLRALAAGTAAFAACPSEAPLHPASLGRCSLRRRRLRSKEPLDLVIGSGGAVLFGILMNSQTAHAGAACHLSPARLQR